MLFYFQLESFFPNVRHLGYSNYLKNWIHFERNINEFIIYIITDGNMYIEEDGVQYHLKAGDFFVLEKDKTHKGYASASVKYYYFHLNNNPLLQRVTNNIDAVKQTLIDERKQSILSNPFLPNEKPGNAPIVFPKQFKIKDKLTLFNISSLASSAIDDYYTKYENYKLLVSSSLLQILIMVSREYITQLFNDNYSETDHSSIAAVHIHKLTQYIKQNYHKKVNMEIIEEYMNLNYNYLNELFKKYYKTTIGKYIQNVRIANAKKLIEETDLHFSEIAYLVGINDPYYFSKIFKNNTGYTPTQYASTIKMKQVEFPTFDSVKE